MNSRCLCTILNLLKIEGLRHYCMSKLGFVVTIEPAIEKKIDDRALAADVHWPKLLKS